jgi:hypothetical protein
MSTTAFLVQLRRAFLPVFVLALAGLAALPGMAQAPQANAAVAALKPVAQANRVAAHADFSARAAAKGMLPEWVHAFAQTNQSFDLSQQMHLQVLLQRDPAAQTAFEKLLADQQDPGSPLFHQWLTPAQVGSLYGPTEADLAAVTEWLTSEGLTVDEVQPNRVLLDVSGPAATVASALRTSFAHFTANGQTRFSAVDEPSIPTALMPVIGSINGLTEVRHEPTAQRHMAQTTVTSDAASGGLKPLLTASDGTHFLMPDDFNTIYDIKSVLASGDTGATIGSATQKIAIIGRSRVVATDISQFETLAGMNNLQPTTIVAGTDPGTTNDGNQDEATLDVDRVLGTAPGAEADLVIAATVCAQNDPNDCGVDGIYTAAAYNVNHLVDPIMTLSFGSCESGAGSTDSNMYSSLFSTAAAEGISVFVSSGDSGADGCFSAGAKPVTGAASANDLCNAYTTCVGGTQFADTANPSAYWSSTNNNSFGSALSYIPEGAWNEPICTGKCDTTYQMAATGGGPSIYITRPGWQTGTGVPAGNFRLTPDVAFASSSHDGFFACLAYVGTTCGTTTGNISFIYFSGTSASAPSMAAIASLLNTKAGKSEGLLGPILYSLAGTAPAAFHDVTVASSGVSGCSVGTASLCNNSTPSTSSLAAGVTGFSVGTGYDEATGLGSLDVANFINAAANVTAGTSLVLSPVTPNPAAVNQMVTLTATLTPSTTGSTSPTGTVTFYSNGSAIGSAVALSNDVATLTTSFGTSGSYVITAIYSGDTKYATSTATGVTLAVDGNFTLTPTALSYGTGGSVIVSGATFTDTLTIASIAPFSNAITLSCVATAQGSNTAAGSCSVSPNPATPASGGSVSATITIHTTIGTSGTLNVVVTGTSGSTVNVSPTITVSLTPPSFTIAATPGPATLSLLGGATAGNTSVVTVTSVNGFAGNVGLSCNAAAGTGGNATGSCSALPATVALVAGGTASSTITINSTAATYGALNVIVSGTGTTAGSAVAVSAPCGSSTVPCITANLAFPFSLSAAPATLAFTAGASTGNTSTISVASVIAGASSFAGTVDLSCSITTSSIPAFPATCAVTPSVNVTSGGTSVATLTISSHTTVTQGAVSGTRLAGLGACGAAMFALLFAWPRRRKQLRGLRGFSLALLFVCGLLTLSGCSGSSSPSVITSSAGTYTVVVTGTAVGSSASTPTQAMTTVSVSIQ